MRKALVLVFLLCLVYPALTFAEDPADLKKTVDELKSRIEVIEAEKKDIDDRFTSLMDVSGYADSEYITSDKSGDYSKFRMHHLSLFFKRELSEQWRVFTELEFEDGVLLEAASDNKSLKAANGKLFLEVLSIEHLYSPYLNFTFGRFFTPAGIWNIDHYPPFVPTQDRPMQVRNIFPQLTDGLQLWGAAELSSAIVSYNLYTGNGEGNTGASDGNEEKSLGARVKVKLPMLANLELGTSFFKDEDNTDIRKRSYGADVSLQWKTLRFQSEYAKAGLNGLVGDYAKRGLYSQLIYGVQNWDFIYRYDWYDPKSDKDHDGTTINTVALNYHFTPTVVGKAEHHMVSIEDPLGEDYNKTILSIAIYLGE